MTAPPPPPPPPPPPSYRPWEDTSAAATSREPAAATAHLATAFPPNGRLSLQLLSSGGAASQAAPSSFPGPRKRRRLSGETMGVVSGGHYTLPSLTQGPQSSAIPRRASDTFRGGSIGSSGGGGGGGGGGGIGGGGGSSSSSSGGGGDFAVGAYGAAQISASNQFHPSTSAARQPPQSPRPLTPSRNIDPRPPLPPPPATNTLSVLVSSIHNLVLDITAPSTSYHHHANNLPAQITPQQLPSMETLTTCLETVFSLLLRHKSPSPTQGHHNHQHSAVVVPDQQAYTANLSSLRHSLSTLQLAHTTLAKEHSSLLAAYSRSQTRAKTLEGKLVVCTEETESLSTERERLMSVVEGLEETLEEVRADRDELRLELMKTGAQWGAIIQNAGRLTAKASAVELALTAEVAELKDEVQFLRRNPAGDPAAVCTPSGDPAEKERRELKGRIKELERCLDDVRRDGRGIRELAEKMARLGKGISECR